MSQSEENKVYTPCYFGITDTPQISTGKFPRKSLT